MLGCTLGTPPPDYARCNSKLARYSTISEEPSLFSHLIPLKPSMVLVNDCISKCSPVHSFPVTMPFTLLNIGSWYSDASSKWMLAPWKSENLGLSISLVMCLAVSPFSSFVEAVYQASFFLASLFFSLPEFHQVILCI